MRCFGCMAELPDGTAVCPVCGYESGSGPQNAQFLEPGARLAERYLVGRVLGSGGFGVTYLAWDEVLGRKVAVKEYFPSSLSTRVSGQRDITVFTGEKERIFRHGLQRFQEEAQLLTQLNGYDGIVSVYDVLEANGTAYIVMEYLEGITLREKLKRDGPMGEEELLSWVVPMLLSLKFVHQLGCIHRDISPDNIMCLSDGTVKLLDFGAARYTVMEESQSLSVIVKQGFTPVEQYQSHGEQGPWTDLYAVGATMYDALTGVTPEESLERLANDTLRTPAQLGVPLTPAVESAILSALNVRGEDRPQDIDAFLGILTGQDEGRVVREKKKRFSPRWATVICLALVGAAGIAVGVFRLANRTDDRAGDAGGMVDVPNVIRMSVADADQTLAGQALSLRIDGGRLFDQQMVEAGYVELGRVMTQDPEGGAAAESGSAVGVEISKGKRQQRLPDMTDMTAENALEYLEKSGFDENLTVETETVPSDGNMPGTIVSQSQPGGSAIDFDGAIVLQISAGPETAPASPAVLTVGDYAGEDFAALKERLLEDGVYLVKSDAVYSPDFPPGTVVSQYPAPGEEIRTGSAIYAAVSLGDELAYVPDLLYLSVEEAKRALAESGLSWRLEYAPDPMVALDHVTGQETEAGARVPFGTEIGVSVSGESEYAELPARENISFAEAFLTAQAGETGTLLYSYEGTEELVWASSNPMIVSITEDGVFTAERFGAATVTVSAGGNVASCVISVQEPGRISRPEVYRMEVGDQIPLAPHIPEEELEQVVWRCTNPAAASVDETGLVTAAGEGYACVTASRRDRVTAFDIFVAGREDYVVVPKSSLSGAQTQAEEILRAQGLPYTVRQRASDSKASGQIIQIRYQGYSDEGSYYIQRDSQVVLYVSTGRNQVTAVSVNTPPAKTVYRLGETPDYRGMVLAVTYADGTVKMVSSGYQAPAGALRQTPSQTVSVSYEGKTAPVTFTVRQESTLEFISRPGKTTYAAGEALDTTGLVLRYTDEDGKVSEVREGFQVSGDTSKTGRQTVTVKYKSLSVSYTVTVEGKETLSIKTKPRSTTCFIGDRPDPTGLVLSYTNASGRTEEVKSGFQTFCDTSRAGRQKVEVTYKALSASYEITVREPSVTVRFERRGEQYVLYAETDPADQPLTWSSSNESVFYFSGSHFIIQRGGTATASASMTYNGVRYTGSCQVTVEQERVEYAFRVYEAESPSDGSGPARFSVESNIPNFDPDNVIWSISDTSPGTERRNGSFYVYEAAYRNFTITATYTYGGRTYTDTLSHRAVQQPEVSYSIHIVDQGHSNSRGRFTVTSDIPGFDLSKVIWTADFEPPVTCEAPGDGSFLMWEYGIEDGMSYTVRASYEYNGKSYSDAFTYTYRQPAAPSATDTIVYVTSSPVVTSNPSPDSHSSVSNVYPAGTPSIVERDDSQ